jgi:hypothetical protein
MALVAAAAKEEPDQKNCEKEPEREQKRDHRRGSITAAVP